MKTKNEKYEALKAKGVELKHINNLSADEVDVLYVQNFGPEGTNEGNPPLDPFISLKDNTVSTPPADGDQDSLEEVKEEAAEIIESAKAEADQIIESAKKFGFDIVQEAEEKVAGIAGEEAKLDEEEDDTDVGVKPLVFKTSGWCEELEMSFKKGIYHPKSAKEYKVLKKYAVQE